MLKKIFLIFVFIGTFLNAYESITEEGRTKQVLIKLAEKLNSEEFKKDANNFKFDLKENYKDLAVQKYEEEKYSYMKKICKDNNIDKDICFNKFVSEIEENLFYEDFRDKKINIYSKTEDREYINKLYKKYPEYKEYIRVNFDTNTQNIIPLSKDDLKITDIFYAIGEKKEKILEFLNYYFVFGFFVFILMISKDFKSKKTKKGAIIYISMLTIIYVSLQFL